MEQKRRVILDNDGGDTFRALGASYEEFTAMRFTPVIGSGVNTIFYTAFDAFGCVPYQNSVAYTKTSVYGKPENSLLPKMYDDGGDPIQYALRFCRRNGMEFFFGFRMNDMHDSASEEAFSRIEWKQKHRDCLLSPNGGKPPYGGANGVDYRCAPVREMLLAVTAEACERFDIDGIFYDFFRHPILFHSVAFNGRAEPEDVACMTAFMRDARRVINEAGRRRGRKIELAVRTPDSLPYCLQLGMDLEAWMREGLIDDYLPASYLQINFWDYSVALGHKYGVNVYPSLDESRVANMDGGRRNPINLRRCDPVGMRGRIRNADYAGCDGFMLFNYYFRHRTAEYRESILRVTDEFLIEHAPRRYALSPRGDVGVPHTVPPEYRELMRLPTVAPSTPVTVDGDFTGDYYLAEPSHAVNGIMRVYFDAPCTPVVRLNDTELQGAWEENVFVATVPGSAICGGINRFLLHTDSPAVLRDVTLEVSDEEPIRF